MQVAQEDVQKNGNEMASRQGSRLQEESGAQDAGVCGGQGAAGGTMAVQKNPIITWLPKDYLKCARVR